MLIDGVENIIKNNTSNNTGMLDKNNIQSMVDSIIDFVFFNQGYTSDIHLEKKDNIKLIIYNLVFEKEYEKLISLGINFQQICKLLSASSIAIIKNEVEPAKEVEILKIEEPDSDKF
jgi:hypothetical protein